MSVTKVTDAMRNVTQVDAAKITTGTIPEARITTLASTKLTGTIADARISASSVNAHVDLTAVRQDIAMLALYNAVSDNRVAYNLPNSFIDQFEDDTGLTTQTDVDRVSSGEYVASVYTSPGTPVYVIADQTSGADTITCTSDITLSTGAFSNWLDNNSGTNWDWGNGATVIADAYIRFQFSATQLVTEFKWYHGNTTDNLGVWQWQGSDSASSGYVDIGSTFEVTGAVGLSPFVATAINGNTTSYVYYQLLSQGTVGTNANNTMDRIHFKRAGQTTTVNATGTLISDQQTASALTKMSGVVLVKDGGSSATVMGTHLKIYFSATGAAASFPSAWVEAASYTAVTAPFSTGVTMYKLGETTVPSGTLPTIRAVWASQTSGGYESQLHGWAMNY